MRGLTREDWNTDVDYDPPRRFDDGMEGLLQSKFSRENQVQVAWV